MHGWTHSWMPHLNPPTSEKPANIKFQNVLRVEGFLVVDFVHCWNCIAQINVHHLRTAVYFSSGDFPYLTNSIEFHIIPKVGKFGLNLKV